MADTVATPAEWDAAIERENRELALVKMELKAGAEELPAFRPYPAFDAPASALRRLSPRRNRWPEIQALDRRVEELEQRRVTIQDELQALQEQHRHSLGEDLEALAVWVAAEAGARPEATAPAVEARIAELEANRDAIAIAVERVLSEKESLVERHRSRLAKDAGKAKTEAIARYLAAVDELERAREDAVELRRAELWARLFPREEAVAALDHQYVKGGRKAQALPELSSRAAIAALYDLLREDVAWLEGAADAAQRAILEDRDPRHDENTVWTDTPEGEQARKRQAKESEERIKAARWQGSRWEE